MNPWIRTAHPWRITVIPAQQPPPGAVAPTVEGPAGVKRYRVACRDCDWTSGPHATRPRCNDLASAHHAGAHRTSGDAA